MKTKILTIVAICIFTFANAQEKANHNTTRSNKTNGIQIRGIGGAGADDDCDGLTNSKLFVKMTKRGTPDLNLHCCKAVEKIWEDNIAIAVKEAARREHSKKHLFTKNGVIYYYNGDLDKLNKCKLQLKRNNWVEVQNSNDAESATKLKKRNKNFNRKGERIKRTRF